MYPSSLVAPVDETLERAARRALHRARQLDTPVLCRFNALAPSLDPWEAFTVNAPYAMAWQDDGLCWAGLGDLSVASELLTGERVAEEVLGVDPESARALPVGWIASTFDGRPGTGPWAGWPGTWHALPSTILWSRRDRSKHGVIGQTLVTPRDDLGRVIDAVLSAFRRGLLLAAYRPEVPLDRPRPPALAPGGTTRAAWDRIVQAGLEAIEAGRLQKVVPARSVHWRADPAHRLDPVAVAFRLRQQHPQGTTFAIRRGARVFTGATPERLASLRDGEVHTHALAGTARLESCRAESTLIRSPKERHEHALVVDSIVESLARISDRIEMATQPRVVALRDLAHLETPIRAWLKDGTTLAEIVAALHPTAAVSGTPRDAALEWIARHERVPRGLYAGPIGWWSGRGDGEVSVALRATLLDTTEAWAWAGTGVVSGSTLEGEWLESSLKLRAVADALGGAPVPE